MLVKKMQTQVQELDGKEVAIQGWVRTNRASKNIGFIVINDGSCFSNVQVVYEASLENFKEIGKITLGSAVEVKGVFVATPDGKQPFEIHAQSV